MSENLNLAALRAANIVRLPRFMNNLGEKAHSKPDGSDWSPRMWMIALMGEVGETAEARKDGYPCDVVASEVADIQIYLDIMAQRIMDSMEQETETETGDCTEKCLFDLIIAVGAMCERHKKFVRGDKRGDYGLNMAQGINTLMAIVSRLYTASFDHNHETVPGLAIDLAKATRDKFNKTSEKIKVDVILREDFITVDGRVVMNDAV